MAIKTPHGVNVAFACAILRHLHHAMPKHSLAQAAVLLEAAAAEAEGQPLCQSDIVTRLRLSQPTASRIITAMARGPSPLIHVKKNPTERRRLQIHLGPAGHALLASLAPDQALPPH